MQNSKTELPLVSARRAQQITSALANCGRRLKWIALRTYLARDVAPHATHGYANVGAFEGRGVVHTIPGDSDDFIAALQALDNLQFLRRSRARKDQLFLCEDDLPRRVIERLKLGAGHDSRLNGRVGVVHLGRLRRRVPPVSQSTDLAREAKGYVQPRTARTSRGPTADRGLFIPNSRVAAQSQRRSCPRR